jgi:hypothetical protein
MQKEATMAATSEPKLFCSLPGWQHYGNRIEKTFNTLTQDDVAVAGRIQRLVGDHRHPIGRAGPWSPRGTLAAIRPRPVGQAGP